MVRSTTKPWNTKGSFQSEVCSSNMFSLWPNAIWPSCHTGKFTRHKSDRTFLSVSKTDLICAVKKCQDFPQQNWSVLYFPTSKVLKYLYFLWVKISFPSRGLFTMPPLYLGVTQDFIVEALTTQSWWAWRCVPRVKSIAVGCPLGHGDAGGISVTQPPWAFISYAEK